MKVDRQTIAILIGITIGTVCISFGVNKLFQHKNSKVEEYVYMSQQVNTPLTEEENEETKKDNNKEVEEIVFDGLTLTELGDKLNRSLKSTLAGQGHFIASYSLEKGVDPYLATAIMLHETGCKWNCSYLTNACNNVGGQKGSGCGEYASFPSIEEGIYAFISNIYYNYYLFGLNTPDLMNSKYAESTRWASNVNKYINEIKSKSCFIL